MDMIRTVAVCNLGCSKNIVDGERIASFLSRAGFALTTDFSAADIIVVNTCAFIQEATREAVDTILAMAQHKKSGSCKTLAVAGCFSERYRHEAAKELAEVDLWVGVHTWIDDLSAYLGVARPEGIQRALSEPIATQYLKIAEGCSHRCAFCVIPAIRGAYASRGEREILDEAAWLERRGVKELILVSQDTSWYGRDRHSSLTRLLERLLAATAFPWIRLMYLHPRHIDDSLLALVGAESRICSYFDIPLQHASDSILAAMRRGHTAREGYALIDRIRSSVPDAAIRTSFILGFPGETRKHVSELASFIEQVRFDKLGVFPFSPEQGTAAANMRPRPRTNTAMQRCEEIMALQRDISRELLERRIGGSMRVLIDRVADNPDYVFAGRTFMDAPEVDGVVHLVRCSAQPGDIIDAEIIDADDYDLFARAP